MTDGQVYASQETTDFFGADFLRRLNDIADRDKIVIVTMDDLQDEDGSVPDEDTLRTRLQTFMHDQGVTLDDMEIAMTLHMLDDENERGFFYQSDDSPDGHAIIVMQNLDRAPEEMFELMSGDYVRQDNVQGIPGDGRDWRIAVLLHEAGHTSPEQTAIFDQFYKDFEERFGVDYNDLISASTDLTPEQLEMITPVIVRTEIMSDQLFIEEWARLHEEGLVSDPNVPEAFLAARAIASMTEDTTHITNIPLNAGGDTPEILVKDAMSGALLARDRVRDAVDAYREHYKQAFIERESQGLDPNALDAEILKRMILFGRLNIDPDFKDGVIAALEAGDQDTIDNLKALPNFHEGLFEDARLGAVIALSGEPYSPMLNSDAFYQEAKNLYLSGEFEDDLAAKTAVYEFLVAARDYAPDAFEAAADDTFPPPDQPIIPGAPIPDDASPQVYVSVPTFRV